jgi:hypothetical protein
LTWEEFAQQAPDLAALGEECFERTGLVLVGTIRKNGWPRISPVEPLIAHGRLYLGMMWQSRKALDLLRDPRCVVHSTISDRHATEGEFKVYGRVVDVQDPEERRRYGVSLLEKIGVDPEAPGFGDYHLFSVDVESAAFAILKGQEWDRKVWNAG